MSRNGSGTYNLPVNSWNPAVNGAPATPSDWQALVNDIASALTQSISRDGQTPITANIPMGGNKFTGLGQGSMPGDSVSWDQLFSQGQPLNLASAATTDIGGQNTSFLNITGTATITSFGTSYNGPRFLRFNGALTLTHNASTLILPAGANITTAENDVAIVVPYGAPASGWIVASYTSAAGMRYTPAGTGAVETTVQEKFRNDLKTVSDFWVLGDGTDESAKAQAMINEHNYLYVGEGVTLTAKNLVLNNNTQVIVNGALRLPLSCVDNDKIIYADQKLGLKIDIKELNGNFAGQSGDIGTHLIYLARCPEAEVKVSYAHDHYIGSGAPMPSPDGFRNASTGAIWLYQCDKADVKVRLLEGWGREGVYLQECDNSSLEFGHGQGHPTRNTEYSSVQMSGNNSHLLRASSDFAGASGVGFDVADGTISNVLSTNTRENHGINFGHTGFPASRSVGNNLVVDSCWLDGIKVSASTEDLVLGNFSVSNAGRYGLSASDGSLNLSITSGKLLNSGASNLQVSALDIRTSNVDRSSIDELSITVTLTSGQFISGESITAGGDSATVRHVNRDLGAQEQILFLNSVVGTFSVSDVVTGATSGAIGTVNAVSTPTPELEQLGGRIIDPTRLYAGTQDQVRFADGTALLMFSDSIIVPTPATLHSQTINYSSNVIWSTAPKVVAQIANANSTGGYSISQLEVSSTTSSINVDIIASVAQTYGVSFVGIGRWS